MHASTRKRAPGKNEDDDGGGEDDEDRMEMDLGEDLDEEGPSSSSSLPSSSSSFTSSSLFRLDAVAAHVHVFSQRTFDKALARWVTCCKCGQVKVD